MALSFDRTFDPQTGTLVPVAPGVARITAPNPGPFTFTGTNTYLIGTDRLAVLDPGPQSPEHLDAILRAVAGRTVSHILVSHTHRDHSPLARPLSEATGAPVLAQGPHTTFRPRADGESSPLDAGADTEFRPDRTLEDSEAVEGDGWALETVLTPGHAANHACFALRGTGILFSADHVMAWATTVIAPPDGAMRPFMLSLDKLLAREDTLYLPGHGGPVRKPKTFVRGLRAHRRMRERAILERLVTGDRTILAIVEALYADTDPRLHGAAGLSVLAHCEDLCERGLVEADGPPSLEARFTPRGQPPARP
ncbi:MAG: MBL fold metallo-hydrolase [Mesorhizobium amorphae]|nr:MAG: MBL fold metallo-hydrolase [Mesorhizobium amorphae]